MSALTLFERLRRHTRARSDAALSRATGVAVAVICRVRKGDHAGDFRLSTLRTISRRTGLSVPLLAAWWAEPLDALDAVAP